MTSGQFTVRIKPDIVNGDVSTLIQSNAADKPFSADDILFDWQPLQIPKGANKLISISGFLMGQDGGAQVNSDLHFIFAKSINGVAPTTLGNVNTAQTACFELPLHFIGGFKVEGTSYPTAGLKFGDWFSSTQTGNNGALPPVVLEGEPNSGQNVGYDVIYVACFVGSAVDFSTGVLLNDGSDVADDAGTSLTVDGVDPRKCFQIGDVIYIHDVDTAIGTIASMTATTIVLESNNVGAIADDDEFVNSSPVTCIFGFEK